MDKINDGGPAFPVSRFEVLKFDNGKLVTPRYDVQEREQWATGLSLRDYFAAKAMQGLLSQEKLDVQDWPEEFVGKQTKDIVASIAYTYADAMLKAREEQ